MMRVLGLAVLLGALPRARSGRCYAVAPGAAPFCGTGYDVHDANATAADATARQLYDRYAPLNAEQSCQQIYKEYVCAAYFPACVPPPTPAGKPGVVLACREHCVYARLCSYPTVRGLHCKTLNSAHEKGFMIRQPLDTVFGETGAGTLVQCLAASGGTHSTLPGDGKRYALGSQYPENYHEWAWMPTFDQYANLLAAPGRHSFGMLGVDNFGHADRIFLDFVLAKHPEFVHALEFGTYRG